MEESTVFQARTAPSTTKTLYKGTEKSLLFDSKDFHNHLKIALHYVLNTSPLGAMF